MNAVILCNGIKPEKHLIQKKLESANLFIAADGGANLARELQLQPDLIVGDLDSYLPLKDRPEEAELIRDPDQETNDLEKALQLALDRGITRVTVFGVTGKRLDHTLKNLSVLKQFHPRFEQIRYADSFGELFLLPKQFSTTLAAGTTVSLIPLSTRVDGIQTDGLKYSLNNETLGIGVRDGSSNEAVAETIVITHEKGDLLIYIATNPERP